MDKKFFAYLLLLLALSVIAPVSANPININTADAETLSVLHGIGPKKAAAIINYRIKHGPFRSIEDLINVPGIGAKTLDKNRAHITVEPPAPRRKTQAPPVHVYMP